MAMKHTLVAGITAFALLVAPTGLSAQWGEHGPAISTAPSISTAYAASKRPTTKPPSNGGPGTTTGSGGNVSKARGFHPSLFVDQMNEYCQTMAEIVEANIEASIDYANSGNGVRAAEYEAHALATMNTAESRGCVIII